jgi:hypothetical protein
MPILPTYNIVFWYRIKPETMNFRESAIKLAEAFPYETSSDQDNQVRDMHWGTEDESEAKAILERLRPFASDPNVVKLLLRGPHGAFEAIIFKDELNINHDK